MKKNPRTNTDEHRPTRTRGTTDHTVRASPCSSVLVRVSALLALLLLPAALSAETISPGAYRERLVAIDGSLRAGDWTSARDAARRLTADRIAFGKESLQPDLSVLQPLADAEDAGDARAVSPRLARLVAALADQGGGSPKSQDERPDPKLLEKARSREALTALPQGKITPDDQVNVLDVLSEVLDPVRRWFDDLWEHLKDWWRQLFPEAKPNQGLLDRLLNLPMTVILLVVALAVVGGWLAVRVLRERRRRRKPAPEAAAPPPAADDDPLSREVNEWERYAGELAAAGRRREAVRAWYHAVLVSLFRSGVLHYRKGRTNWEYVAALAAGFGWRSCFVDLTRCFEREWYGRDSSTPEALDEAAGLAGSLLGALREAA